MNFASEFVYARKGKLRLQQEQQEKGTTAAECAANAVDYEPDTNVVSARFDHLIDTSNAHAGDPVKCQNCEAILSKISKVSEPNTVNGKRVWQCEFCNFQNQIFIEAEEMPSEDEVTYVLEPAPDKNVEENIDNKYLIYCIDISGSMSVTTEVRGNFKLPTDQIRRDNFLNAIGENNYHHNRMSVRHISRLEAVQVAIEENLTKLSESAPEKKVGLVTFNLSVNIIGDGEIEKLRLIGDDLNNKEEIKKIAENTPDFSNIKKTRKVLSEKLLNLEEGGATALGPALYYSILIASKKRGSQVILCTDGLANKGIGSLEATSDEERSSFYNELGNLALENGVSVSLITIEGTNCKLGLLGDIADKTGGIVNIVNPLKLQEEFASILEEQIIATNVEATFILPKALYIRDHLDLNNKQSFTHKQIGNVTKETEITFEFGLREDHEIDTNLIKELPFQLKIMYNPPNGSKLLRVLTKLRKITNDIKTAEKESDRKILASHFFQSRSRGLQQNFASSTSANKFTNYIRTIATIKNDDFSEETFNSANVRLEQLTDITSNLRSASAMAPTSSNAYEQLDDQVARDGYLFKNIRSKAMAKKK